MDAELRTALLGEVDDWVRGLPAYQQALIADMLSGRDVADVALMWLSSAGPRDTAPFGGIRAAANSFYDKLLTEVHKLFCSSSDYQDERAQLIAKARMGQAVIIVEVSQAIAPHVGAASVLIGPAVALTLAVVGRAGTETACETLSQMLRQRAEAEAGGPQNPPPAPPS